MTTIPTADQVAHAMVAACRETGEHPLSIADGTHKMAVHYAYHALRHVLGVTEVDRVVLARILNAPGRPTYFHRSTCWWVLGQAPQQGAKPASWWSDEALARVIDAIPANEAVPQLAPTETPLLPSRAAPIAPKTVEPPAAETPAPVSAEVELLKIIQTDTSKRRRGGMKSTPAMEGTRAPPVVSVERHKTRALAEMRARNHSPPSKADLARMMAEAVRNTAALQAKEREE